MKKVIVVGLLLSVLGSETICETLYFYPSKTINYKNVVTTETLNLFGSEGTVNLTKSKINGNFVTSLGSNSTANLTGATITKDVIVSSGLNNNSHLLLNNSKIGGSVTFNSNDRMRMSSLSNSSTANLTGATITKDVIISSELNNNSHLLLNNSKIGGNVVIRTVENGSSIDLTGATINGYLSVPQGASIIGLNSAKIKGGIKYSSNRFWF